MRTFWLLISLFVLLSCGARPQVPGTDRGTAPLTIMSYNIRLDTDRDRANAWPNRREFLANQILFHAPEVLGIQEGLPQQVKWLDRRLANYAVTGEGRRGGNKGEYSAIYYDRRRLRAEDAGTFWLSETPQRVSTGWDAALPRICTWVRFRRLTDRRAFYVFNTHFDHVGERARQESAGLILGSMATINRDGLPTVLMGDLNLEPAAPPIQLLNENLVDTYRAAEIRLGPEGTFSGFNYNYTENRERRIDYIFVSPEWRVEKYAVLTDAVDRRFASDHFPVITVLTPGETL